MMKFYLMIIMLIFLNFIIKKKILIIYMYMMLILLMFLMIFINYNDYFMNIYYWMSLDNLSYPLIILSIFIISMMFLISLKINNNKIFSMLLLILLINLMLSFNSMNYFLFYLFFEISLIPTFILIMMFGNQPERLNASMFMMLYTLFASLPLMIILFMMNKYFNSMNYYFMYNFYEINKMNKMLFYFFMLFAFLIKLPMFMFHMWLPKAHVEAPISGSMILAGVMLKLGGYGIIRSMNMMIKLCKNYNIYLISLNIIGMIILSILCLRQNDLKVLVAYSSVVHMSMMLCSIMTLYMSGKFSGILLMIGHGFCSPGLFMLVNYIYLRSKSRNLFINKGMINYFPSMMFWWFMFCIANLAAPISLNLIGELFIAISLINWSNYMINLLIIGMIFSASYSLYLFSTLYHGNFFFSMKFMFNNYILEYKLMLLLWIPLNFLILKMEIFY